MLKTPHAQSSVGSWDVQQVHAAVARSTCVSCENKKINRSKLTIGSTFGSWAVQKVHVVLTWSTPTASKTDDLGPLLDVLMSKKGTLLWSEAMSKPKVKENRQVQRTFGRSDVVLPEQNVKAVGCGNCKKRWQAQSVRRGSAKMNSPWQAQYKRQLHQRCLEVRALISGLYFGSSDLQVC